MAGEIVNEARRAPSPEVEERQRAEWPGLWRRIDELSDATEELQLEVGSVFLSRRRRR